MINFRYDDQGNLCIALKAGGGSGGTSSPDGAPFSAGNPGTPAEGLYQVSRRTLADGQLGIIAVDNQGRIVLSPAGGSAVTIADGGDVAEGAIADAAVTGDSAGTVNAHLRGLDKILADVWDAGNHWLKASIQNSTLTVVQATAASLNATVVGNGTFAVQVSAALPAGTNVIGHVITDTGSTTVVTGNVTVVNGGTFAVQITAALPAGSNVIGHVIVDSGTITAVTAISNALPAGTNLLGRVSASLETSTVYNGTAALTPKFALIAASSSGATAVVAAVTSKKIRVLGLFLMAAGTTNVNLQSHTTTATATGLLYLIANTGVSSGFFPTGFFETVAGEGLDINLTGSVGVGGQVVYVEV